MIVANGSPTSARNKAAIVLLGPEELEEQMDNFNGDAMYDPPEDAPAERRTEGGPVATSRGRSRSGRYCERP